MPLDKPGSVANDPIKSAKWDEITEGRSFTRSDVPALALLCQWHKIVELAPTSWTGSASRPPTETIWAI